MYSRTVRCFRREITGVIAGLAAAFPLLASYPAYSDEQTTDAPPRAAAKEQPAKPAETKAEQPGTRDAKSPQTAIGAKPANLEQNDKDFETYLDRLMMAESGGRLNAKNSRSSALGPYQFIRATFLSVARTHFADDIADLTTAKILALRTNLKFSRKAAAAYTRDNAAHLAAEGLKTTYGNLRLAFLLGPGGAVTVLQAEPKTKVAKLLGRRVMRANPFMAGMSAKDLIERAHREISIDPKIQLATTGMPKTKKRPRIKVRCNLARPSCRKWLALKRARLNRTARR